jgi:hypothetical protein
MKLILTIVLAVALSLNAFDSKAAVDSTTLNSSVITSNLNLNRTTTYLMKGFNYIRNGATINIPAGTVILGDFETKGVLVIERGSKIYANGTEDCPVLFTSEKPAGSRNTGDWGGIIVLGRSGINTVSGADSAEIEGFGPGLGPIYGGQPRVDNDSSGVLRYVRIEFPGVNLTGISGNEINGLTMGGVGNRTVIEHVQVSYSGDDSFEWFGGNVNCKYLVAYKGLDDDWDCDNGYRGRIQYGLSVRDKDIADVSSSNGFEIDNNANSPNNFNNPRTRPIFSNMTVVGPFETTSTPVNPLFQRGAHTRRNNLACVYNSIVMGWRVGVRLDGSGIYNAATGDTIQFRNNIFGGNLKLADTAASTSFNAHSFLQNGAYANTVIFTTSGVGLTSPYNIYPDPSGNNVTNWVPTGGSPALSGASFSNGNLSGFEAVSYRGAFGSTNWTANWAQFNPKNYALPTPTDFIVTAVPQALVGVTPPADCPIVFEALLVNGSCQVVGTSTGTMNPSNYQTTFCFDYTPTGSYSLVLRHKNSIETWSKLPYSFNSGAANNYNFTTAQSQAYGDNLKLVNGLWTIYTGDPNQDCVVDASDISALDNDAFNFVSGCVNTDLNGDGVVDASDISVAENNAFDFVSCFKPCP